VPCVQAGEQQRDRHQADPHPHKDEAEDRIGQQILAGHHRQARPGVRGKDQHSGDKPNDRMVDDCGQPRDGIPPTRWNRGCRHAKIKIAKEITKARTVPTTTKENGSGRSRRDAIPSSGMSIRRVSQR
jgi:hypothetical protein